MSARNDGGYAYPQPMFEAPEAQLACSAQYGFGGMSLRDWFAGMAMQGLVSGSGDAAGGFHYLERIVAESAYALADAMISERAK